MVLHETIIIKPKQSNDIETPAWHPGIEVIVEIIANNLSKLNSTASLLAFVAFT